MTIKGLEYILMLILYLAPLFWGISYSYKKYKIRMREKRHKLLFASVCGVFIYLYFISIAIGTEALSIDPLFGAVIFGPSLLNLYITIPTIIATIIAWILHGIKKNKVKTKA